MTDEDLKVIEARLNELPRGPWYVEQVRPGHDDEARVYDRGSWGVCKPTPTQPLSRRPIAEFVASARTDVPALVAEVRRLRSALHGAADVMPAKKFTDICSAAGLSDTEARAIFMGMTGQTNG
jgi:hypothetical protein